MADITSVRYHYIKSNAYRVIHVDGVYGGPTPGRLIYVSFFSERFPIPTVVEHAVKDLGENRFELGEEIQSKREGKEGVVREIEVGAVMTLDMAKKLHAWLGQTIEEIEKPGRGSDTGGSDAG
jgi:hypothetical protein